MNFAEAKDQLVERLASSWGEFQETSTYATIRERYDGLSPVAQKGALALVAVFFALIVLTLPWSYFSSSSTYVESFESRKALIKKLFRANRAADAVRDAPQPISGGELQTRIQGKLTSLGLGDQIGSVAPYDNAAGGARPGIPKGVLQNGVSVALKNLNLRQAVDVGYQMNALDSSTKLVGVEVAATAANAHYFDVTYKFVSFSTPPEPELPAPGAKGGKKSGKPSGRE